MIATLRPCRRLRTSAQERNRRTPDLRSATERGRARRETENNSSLHSSQLLIILILIVGVLAFPGPTNAQQHWGRWNNVGSSFIDTVLQDPMRQRLGEHALSAQTGTKGNTTKTPHLPLTETDFTPADKGHPVVDAFLASAFAKIGPEGQAKWRRWIDRMFEFVETEYRKNNVATAVSFALSQSMETVNGKEVSRENAHELMANINDMLALSERFKRQDAHEKQAIYDSLMLSGSLIFAFRSSHAGETLNQAGITMANAMLKKLTGPFSTN